MFNFKLNKFYDEVKDIDVYMKLSCTQITYIILIINLNCNYLTI